ADWLVGVLAVLRRLHREFGASPHASAALARAARERTTIVAREFLLHALDGAFSEPVVALATAPGATAARAALARLLDMGASSGADTATGMRDALAALRP